MLRGTGAGIALPLLDAMVPSAAQAQAVKPEIPVRLGFFYVPNGVNLNDWRPKDQTELTDLPATLQPLAPVKDKVVMISNLEAKHCEGKAAGHEPAGGGFLVGAKCKHSEEPEVGGISVDQFAAREIGLQTPIDSLALGVDPGHRGDHGYSGTYLSHISWRSKTTPAPLELNPKLLFDRLFRGRAPQPADWTQQAGQGDNRLPESSVQRSILDLTREDTRRLQRQLGFSDRRKLDEYLEGLRNLEQRLAMASRDSHSHHVEGFAHGPMVGGHDDEDDALTEIIIPDGKGIPSVYADHVNLMLDIMTLAFQTDTTRVASFMFSYEKSGRAYPEINAAGSHHSSSHHADKSENLEQLSRINLHHMTLFARLLQRLSTIQEGDSTLLDNVMFVYGSGISDGNKHNHDDLPVLIAGGAGGTVRGGRHLKLEKKTPLCNLYLDMLHRANIQKSKFGDSTERLQGLG